jgi:hypothetical protein
MAIMHKNPMPLSGALFVTNPRKRRRNALALSSNPRRRRNALSTRRTSLMARLRKNADVQQTIPGFGDDSASSKSATKSRTKSQAKKTTAKKTTTATRKLGEGLNYHQKVAVLREAGKLEGRNPKKAKVEKMYAAFIAEPTTKKKTTAKKTTAKKTTAKKTTAKKTTTEKTTARKKSDWSKFLGMVKGMGLTRAETKSLYAKYKNGDKSAADIKKLRSEINKKAKEIKKSQKHRKVGARTYRAAYNSVKSEKPMLFNPFRLKNPRRRKNQGIMGVQPLAMPLQFVESVQQTASDVPVVKFVSFAITPLALGAAVYAVHRLAEPHVMKILEQDVKVQDIPVLKETLRFPYTTTGVVAGLALGALAKFDVLNAQAASLVAASAVSVGIALDMSLRPVAKAAQQVVEQQVAEKQAEIAVQAAEAVEAITGQDTAVAASTVAVNGQGVTAPVAPSMGAIRAYRSNGYGDGGQYMIGRNTTALGAIHYGASADPEYADASPADAQACTCEMTAKEISAAKAGRAMWAKAFPSAPRNLKRSQSLYSRHAGLEGHRYGWVIKMIGFKNFQKIASLPPQQRATVLRQLQKRAVASIPSLVHAQQQQNGSIETASLSLNGTFNAVQGFDSPTYGALMFAGSGY